MRKLNTKQKTMIDNFINANRSAGMFLSVTQIDLDGSIENVNRYESCWSDIERYYSDNATTQHKSSLWADIDGLM